MSGASPEYQRLWRSANKDKCREYNRRANVKRRLNPVYLQQEKERLRKYYKTHRAETIQRTKQWMIDNRERYNRREREYYWKHRIRLLAKIRPRNRIWYAKNQARIRAVKIAWYHKRIETERAKKRLKVANLSDGYVKDLISKGTQLSYRDIPSEMVKAKRIQVQIKREIQMGKGVRKYKNNARHTNVVVR